MNLTPSKCLECLPDRPFLPKQQVGATFFYDAASTAKLDQSPFASILWS